MVVLVLATAVVFPSVVLAEQGDAESAIASARQQIVTCFEAARQAEAAGANISSLTVALNDAGLLLSQSELAYSKSDYGAAQSLASQCSQRLSNFVSEADLLRGTAAQQRSIEFYISVVGSVAGTFVVMLVGFAVWRFVKKKKVLLGVEIDESARV